MTRVSGIEGDSMVGAEFVEELQELSSPVADLEDVLVPQGVAIDQLIGQASLKRLEGRGALIEFLMKASGTRAFGIKRSIEDQPASLAELERDVASWEGDGLVPAG
jgi:hypothetical protein